MALAREACLDLLLAVSGVWGSKWGWGATNFDGAGGS